ncbi:MAG: hypothetical protein B6D63_07335 [Candidatus Latescibacteria bacterium 4484_7]|nr:MAG: hypothetical protein B6D63_07335 [Candidatus Latescibacteria bacterium 4484_7]RKZ08241.1 MAG: hypothetical protein DRQ05_01855 [bacterium]
MTNEDSVNEICRQIIADGEHEVSSILEKARRTADDITSKAEEEGKKAAEKILKEADSRVEAIKRRAVSSVELEVKRERLKVRESLFDMVMEKVNELLSSARGRSEYADILAGLAVEAIVALGSANVTIFADSRDVQLVESKVVPKVKDMLAGLGKEIESVDVKPLDKPSIGGVVVGVREGNVIYDNTFESRLYRMQSDIRTIVYNELFREMEAGRSASK